MQYGFEGLDASPLLTVASELLTNAMTHGASEPELVLCRTDPHGLRVRIEVHDASYDIPTVQESGGVHGGFGLRIVERMAAEWGYDRLPTGKVVWAELELTAE